MQYLPICSIKLGKYVIYYLLLTTMLSLSAQPILFLLKPELQYILNNGLVIATQLFVRMLTISEQYSVERKYMFVQFFEEHFSKQIKF